MNSAEIFNWVIYERNQIFAGILSKLAGFVSSFRLHASLIPAPILKQLGKEVVDNEYQEGELNPF